MTKRQRASNWLRYLATAGLLALALGSSAALAQSPAANAFAPPPVPPDLQVPAGNTLFLKGVAQGTQNYICLPTPSGFAWTFFSPQATLFLTLKLGGMEIRQQIVTHFLSPNPAENGTPRATWQSSLDTSAVWARAIKISTDPAFVATGAIPWLLLEELGLRPGPARGDLLSHTSYIQRLNTSGGVAPAAGCSQGADVGATALVPYTADYFFYRGNPKN